jgi:hypothetical protein
MSDECTCAQCRPDLWSTDGLRPKAEEPVVFIRAFGEPARPITNPELAARVRADAIARENPTPVSAVIAHGTYEPSYEQAEDNYRAVAKTVTVRFDDEVVTVTSTPVDPTGWGKGDTYAEAHAQAFDEGTLAAFDAREAINEGGFFYRDEPQPVVLPSYLYEWWKAEGHDLTGFVEVQDLPRSIDAILADLEENAEELDELRNERTALLEELCDTIDDEVA